MNLRHMNAHGQLFRAARGAAVIFGLFAVVCLSMLVASIVSTSWTWTPNSTPYYVVVKCAPRANISEDVETKVKSVIAEDSITLDIWFSTFLLIVVPIRPSDQDTRQLIRDTWFEGFKNSQDIALRFALGTRTMPLKEQTVYTKENETFGDIIFIDLKEDFGALTNKTLAAISWAHRHVNFSYFMKCDDATYVFVKDLIVELKQRPTTTKLYYGDFMFDQHVGHRRKGKWADTNWNLGPRYIPFARGGGYILSHDLVAILSRDAPHLKWHINEDTAIGAWMSSFDHERKMDGRICMWWKGKQPECKRPILVLILHTFSNDELKQQYNYFHEQVRSNKDVTLTL